MTFIANAKVRIDRRISNLIRSDMEFLIEQANLGKENTKIAKMYLIDNVSHEDIAEELDITKFCVSRRYREIIRPKIEKTANVIGVI